MELINKINIFELNYLLAVLLIFRSSPSWLDPADVSLLRDEVLCLFTAISVASCWGIEDFRGVLSRLLFSTNGMEDYIENNQYLHIQYSSWWLHVHIVWVQQYFSNTGGEIENTIFGTFELLVYFLWLISDRKTIL